MDAWKGASQGSSNKKTGTGVQTNFSDESLEPCELRIVYTPPDESKNPQANKPSSPTGRASLTTVTSNDSINGDIKNSYLSKVTRVPDQTSPEIIELDLTSGNAHGINVGETTDEIKQDELDVQEAIAASFKDTTYPDYDDPIPDTRDILPKRFHLDTPTNDGSNDGRSNDKYNCNTLDFR